MSDMPSRVFGARNCLPVFVTLFGIMLSGCASDFASTLSEASPTSDASASTRPGTAIAAADGAAVQSLATINESRKLKAAGKPKEALALLEKKSEGPNVDRALLVERGFSLLELGQAEAAKKILLQAEAADNGKKDWRVLSGIGVALASQNRPKEAQKYFARALEASPGNAAVLNNMAVAHMIDRKPTDAEKALRNAMTGNNFPPQVTRNLALAQALQVDAAKAKPEATAF